MKTTSAIADTYVPKTTMVNGHALSDNVTVTRSDLGLGTSATVNTGTAVGCIPTVGTALGTTDGQFLATDSSGNLKPSGYTASCFRASTWTPTSVPYSETGGYLGERAALGCAPNCTHGIANVWNYCNDSRYYLVGTKYDNPACKYNVRVDYATNATNATNACKAACNSSGTAFGAAAVCSTRVTSSVTYIPYAGNDGCPLLTSNFLAFWNGAYNTTGSSNLKYTSVGALGTAAACAATAFRSCTWWPNSLSCGCVKNACCAQEATCLSSWTIKACRKCVCQPYQGTYVYDFCLCAPFNAKWVLEQYPFTLGSPSGFTIGIAYDACSAWKCVSRVCQNNYYADCLACVLASPRFFVS